MPASLGVSAVASNASATVVTTPDRTTTSGSTIVLMGTFGAQTFVSFSDDLSNTWTQVQTELGTSPKTRMYYSENITGGIGHNFSMTIGSAGTPSIWMVEILGAKLTGVLDQSASQADVSSPFTSPLITTTENNEFFVAFIGGDSTNTPAVHTAGNGFTLLDEVTNGAGFWVGATAYRNNIATGDYSASFTQSGTGNGRVWIASFKSGDSAYSLPIDSGAYALTGADMTTTFVGPQLALRWTR